MRKAGRPAQAAQPCPGRRRRQFTWFRLNEQLVLAALKTSDSALDKTTGSSFKTKPPSILRHRAVDRQSFAAPR